MKNRNTFLTFAGLLVSSAGIANASEGACTSSSCDTLKDAASATPDALASQDELFMREIASRMIHSLTIDEQLVNPTKAANRTNLRITIPSSLPH